MLFQILDCDVFNPDERYASVNLRKSESLDFHYSMVNSTIDENKGDVIGADIYNFPEQNIGLVWYFYDCSASFKPERMGLTQKICGCAFFVLKHCELVYAENPAVFNISNVYAVQLVKDSISDDHLWLYFQVKCQEMK